MDPEKTFSSHTTTLGSGRHERAIAEPSGTLALGTIRNRGKLIITIVMVLFAVNVFAQSQRVSGTLVVAVPTKDGLVACSDKRAFNHGTQTFNDDLVKIHKVNSRTLFVATNTVGFLDPRTGKVAFDVFGITSTYLARREFVPERQFWEGLKSEIRKQLLAFLATQSFKDQPETDIANNRLLFNLIFYSISNGGARSYSFRVFYEKSRSPVVYIPDVVSEEVRTPKLSGKGKDVMDYLAREPLLGRDPSIFRFDQRNFDIQKTSAADAVTFARRLFVLANVGVPQANVSAAHDCALLSYQTGFKWIDGSANPIIQ
jgi:hypothetical protein